MPDSALITQQELEDLFTPLQVRRMFSDDGSATPGPRLAKAIEIGSQQASAVLGKAWPDAAQIVALVNADTGAKYAVGQFVMAVGADARPEWFMKDGGPATYWRREARKTLEDMVQRKLRSPGERVAGKNTTTRHRMTVTEPVFEFAPHRGRPPRGGF